MTTSPKPVPMEDAASALALLLRSPWLLLLLGFTGGGGIGTLLGRPVLSQVGEDAVTRKDVSEIVDEAVASNNAVLLQQIELLLARDALNDAGIHVPSFTPARPPQ